MCHPPPRRCSVCQESVFTAVLANSEDPDSAGEVERVVCCYVLRRTIFGWLLEVSFPSSYICPCAGASLHEKTISSLPVLPLQPTCPAARHALPIFFFQRELKTTGVHPPLYPQRVRAVPRCGIPVLRLRSERHGGFPHVLCGVFVHQG